MASEVDDGQAWERWVGAASLPMHAGYRPRSPEGTVLHRVVREHLATFLEEARARSAHGFGLPGLGGLLDGVGECLAEPAGEPAFAR